MQKKDEAPFCTIDEVIVIPQKLRDRLYDDAMKTDAGIQKRKNAINKSRTVSYNEIHRQAPLSCKAGEGQG